MVLRDGWVDTLGGHVVGNMVLFTTAEIVLGSTDKCAFSQRYDAETGYEELVVTPRGTKDTNDTS